tara:strand:- start:67 stop:540 length:474 start_codon:yes stop_codon:yes gene_type:complete
MSSAHIPYGFPDALFDSEKISEAYTRKAITPTMVREDANILEAMANQEFTNEFLRGTQGLPFYMAKVAPTDESSGIAFERNFNPMLKHDSEYYGKLGDMISCVERNVGKDGVDEKTVCAKEFKAMRLTAFKNELLYHNVNKRFYMDLITYKRHEAPF